MKPWLNKSGLPDPTAYEATKEISTEDEDVTKIVHAFRVLAYLAGYEICNRVEFRSRKSGRIFK